MMIIETNSCPSGQKSMPLLIEDDPYGCYRRLIEWTFKPLVLHEKEFNPEFLHNGVLAVLFDKNIMEASGYAATMASVFNESVYLVEYKDKSLYKNSTSENLVKWTYDGICLIKISPGEIWTPVRACLRYVTQKPWNRIPVSSKTIVLNPIISCLAGGRNKNLAALAYKLQNKELKPFGIRIHTPKTFREVIKNDIPRFVEKFGGMAVVKNPYSNAGQGVYTITNPKELNSLMEKTYDYDKYIIQQLIGNSEWSSFIGGNKYYHVGTVPSKNLNSFVYDLRMMICSTSCGYRPLVMYSRQATSPLPKHLGFGEDSWSFLGTNLSIKNEDGSWDTNTDRLILMDTKDFTQLGIGIDDIITSFIQTVLATMSIDKMCCNLLQDSVLDLNLLLKMNSDFSLISEIIQGTPSLETQTLFNSKLNSLLFTSNRSQE